jgi:hypothetical protein
MQRLAEDGDGSGVTDPGRLATVVGDLPALEDQQAPAAVDSPDMITELVPAG